jgi:hypothetical protein
MRKSTTTPRLRRVAVAASCGVAALGLAGAAAGATVTTAMSGLDNPRGLAFGPEGALYVAEAGRGGAGPPCRSVRGMDQCYGATGAISRLSHGVQERWVSGLPSIAPAAGTNADGPNDISFHGRAYVPVGLGGDPNLRAMGGATALFGTLLKVAASGEVKEVADVAAYEQAVNPDGREVNPNPFGALALPGRQIVADAGGNAVLQVRANGAIETLAVPDARRNPIPVGPPVVDPVPTAVAQGPDGALYVSELTGVPFLTGFARIHRLGPDGAHTVYATGLTAVVDIAFGDDGALYALQLSACGLFFACPGSIVRVEASGLHTPVYDGLAHPTGLAIGADGAFYVSVNGASAVIGAVLRIEP